MAISQVCGAECGYRTVSTLGAGADRHWTTFIGTTLPTLDTAQKRTGNYAWKFTPGATGPYLQRVPTAATYTVVGARFYIYFDALPGTFENVLNVLLTAGSAPSIRITDTGDIQFGSTALGWTTGPAFSAGQWVGLEIQIDVRANPNVLYLRTDVGATGVWTEYGPSDFAQAATTIDRYRLGLPGTTSGSFNLWADDIVIYEGTTINEHYPIGSGYVKPYRVNASSVALLASGNFKYNNTTNIVSGATDLHTYVDDVDGSGFQDMDQGTTDYISQNVVDGTNDTWSRYAQFSFESASEPNPPRYVNLLHSFRSSGTAANEINERASDDGTNWTAVWGAWTASTNVGLDISETSQIYLHKVLAVMPSTGATWTTAGFNALRVQWGHSDDVTPFPFIDFIGIEAGFSEIVRLPLRMRSALQAVSRASNW